jgi:hypothetical protein
MRPQEMNTDGSGNSYIDVQNVRISLIERTVDDERNWAGAPHFLRFSAYTAEGHGVKPGPELPVSAENVLNLVRAVLALAERGGEQQRAVAA